MDRTPDAARTTAANSAGLHIISPEESERERIAADSLRDFFVDWDEVTTADVRDLQHAIEHATQERDMQAYLQAHPELLIQHLGGGHGRWVIPQQRLGAQYVPDFVIGDAHSGGRDWVAVELEGPQRAMFTKAGDPSRYLWHAIRQILDWRVWIELNRDYATRSRDDEGLGLEDISVDVPGLIIIGRRTEMPPARRRFRNVLSRQLRIEIHTYDWLVDRVAGRAREMERWRTRRESS